MQVVSPVIGEAGFDALFARSLKKTKSAFPSLSGLETVGPPRRVLSHLCENLKKQEVALLEGMVVALMSTFIDLLSTFIGERLTWRLLRNAWPDALPKEPPLGRTP